MKEFLNNKISKKTLYIGIFITIILVLMIIVFGGEEDTASDDSPKSVSFTKSPRSRNVDTSDEIIDSYQNTQSGNVLIPTEGEIEGSRLSSHLPIVIKGFETSVGPITDIQIYVNDYDPLGVIHVEIGGIDYTNQGSMVQATAYFESFLAGKAELEKLDIDISKLEVKLGLFPGVIETASHWVKVYSLL